MVYSVKYNKDVLKNSNHIEIGSGQGTNKYLLSPITFKFNTSIENRVRNRYIDNLDQTECYKYF